MARRKITPAEAATIQDALCQLAEILEAVGIVEVSVSKKKKEVFWDTEGGGLVDPQMLERFSDYIESFYIESLEARG